MMSVLLDFRARSGWGPFNASHFVAVQFHIRNAYVASSKQHYYFLFSSSLSSPLHPLLSPPLLLLPFSSTPSPPPTLNHCWTLKSLSKVVKRSLWLFSFCASGSCSFENLKDIYTHCSTINEVISPSNDHQVREDSRSYKCNVLHHIQWTLVEGNTRKIRTKSLGVENV